jgi:hypothetical protein
MEDIKILKMVVRKWKMLNCFPSRNVPSIAVPDDDCVS